VRFGPAGTVSPVKHRGYGRAGIPPRGISTEISSDFDDSLGRCTHFCDYLRNWHQKSSISQLQPF